MDYISLDNWFKIKFIPVTQIKAHLLNIRHPFFFIFKKNDEKGAFVNPQNLIMNFNVHPGVGYNYINNLETEIDDDNTVRIFFLKLHECVHSKFDSSMKMDSSPIYLLNADLKKLDYHYDTIAMFKKGGELTEKKRR